MDFDYNTVKYLVIVLSLLILGYIIFLIYTDITTVREELNKVKTRLSDTSVSLEELQKELEYVEEDNTISDISKDEGEHALQDILNNNFFSNNSVDPEESDNVVKDSINTFSFNIPFFNKNNETSLPSIEELPESNDVAEEEIKFEKTSSQCQGVISTGRNKGNQCSKNAISDSDFCIKHNK